MVPTLPLSFPFLNASSSSFKFKILMADQVPSDLVFQKNCIICHILTHTLTFAGFPFSHGITVDHYNFNLFL